jgi:hypothetical protein
MKLDFFCSKGVLSAHVTHVINIGFPICGEGESEKDNMEYVNVINPQGMH